MRRKRRTKTWKWLFRYVLYVVARPVFFVFSHLPLRVARGLGEALGILAFRVLRGERERAVGNLELALGKAAPCREIARGVFRHFGRVFGELAVIHRWPTDRILRRIPLELDWERFESFAGKDGPAVVVTGHFGNWELFGLVASRQYRGRLKVFAKRIYFPTYDRWISRIRRRMGMDVIYQDESPREALAWLRSAGIIGILADQDISDVSGVFIDFFGRPAYTPVAPAALALHTGAPLIPVYLVREGDRYRTLVGDPIPSPGTGDRGRDVEEMTRGWTRVLEGHVRSYPEQWAWFHRRWRTTPEKLAARRGRRPSGGRSLTGGST